MAITAESNYDMTTVFLQMEEQQKMIVNRTQPEANKTAFDNRHGKCTIAGEKATFLLTLRGGSRSKQYATES